MNAATAQVAYTKLDTAEYEATAPHGTYYLARDENGWTVDLHTIDGDEYDGWGTFPSLVQAKAAIQDAVDMVVDVEATNEASQLISDYRTGATSEHPTKAAATDAVFGQIVAQLAEIETAADDGLFTLAPSDDGGLFGFAGMKLAEGSPETGFVLTF